MATRGACGGERGGGGETINRDGKAGRVGAGGGEGGRAGQKTPPGGAERDDKTERAGRGETM